MSALSPMGLEASRAALHALLLRALEAARAPLGWISLAQGDRERIEASVAFPHDVLPADTLAAREPLFLDDAHESTLREHRFVAGAPHARMLAAVPLVSHGQRIGMLVVADPQPRHLGPSTRTALLNIAALAVARVETQGGRPVPPAALVVPEALGERLEAEMRRRRVAEERLAQETVLADTLIENLGGANFIVTPEGTLLRWNSAFAAALGRSDEALRTLSPLDFISAGDRPVVASAVREVLGQGRDITLEAEILDGAGNVRPYVLTARAVELGGRRHLLGMARDITLRRRNEQHMARAKERLDLALTSSALALWDWDFATDRVYFNENWSTLRGEAPRESTYAGDEVLGWPPTGDRELLGAAVANAVKGVSEDIDCESRVAHADGEWMWIHWRGRVTQRGRDGQAKRMTGTCTNVTKRKHAEERAEWLATRDALTGLPNRVLLHDRLEQAVANAARQRVPFAFMFIDLDRFKTINDSLGHHAGDQLLKGVAARLTACVRASDTVARLGGDEFAVILENLSMEDEGARAVADKMIASMAIPLVIEGQPLATSCSIGISVFPGDGRDGATLMKNADVAMYHAKEKGRNNYQFFSAEMNARAQERLSVESYLRLAIKRNELVLHYQPRVNVRSGELVGVEALIRWQHPRRGLLAPGKFIDVAEDSGLIVAIGEWVLESACLQLAQWHRWRPGLRLSVNLSVGQVGDGDRLYAAVTGALDRAGLAPGCLELELTESHLMQNIGEKAQLLNRLGAEGVGLAIDDFGTGYSSLSYLKTLPVDAIKIDGSFVRDLHTDPDDAAIVRAIVAMAHALRLTVVAEGVETAAQRDTLRELGCDEYQGFLESAALPPADFERRYRAKSGDPAPA